ncbi:MULTISPECIES: sulfite exporter TauE/SafE family protein [Virgibacillus]|uniref:sulfite exporter TauE/SafE family protein n=1 Tax=Virgibacillus TaxID=84406 RepID=UPI000AC4C2DD|nr:MULTISPECIES: sulfite exporter TauE/SafE family protein [Virgibacillus]MEB5454289.1 sulfite exporter TauE/SafE family protein [Virgibacillus pantothenticus]MEB5458519.1 sulfite exporter TauE/SafE family protein [Virgibacillus pantothenticus]MEB5462694.1 sulfite exporter TauE/SafE family protein [Virgibacillus pantothenticus]MEB5466879.1 sulfite exporter TauE/SafE family protein [Virgibacillus pantothenticus]
MISIFVAYFLIGLVACTVGAMAGLGGGIIIKPLLDMLGHYDLSTIGVLSAATVFSMAVVSLIKARNSNLGIDRGNSFFIAIGSIIGGFTGKGIFNHFVVNSGMSTIIGIFQSALLSGLLIIIYVFMRYNHRIKTYHVQNRFVILCVGLVLGLLSAFLGIGGGPLNVAVLVFIFSMNTKDASINSIFIIFFSQLSSLILVATSTGFAPYDLSMAWFMIPGGMLGGIIGTNLVSKISNRWVERIFNGTLLMIILITLYNIVIQLI